MTKEEIQELFVECNDERKRLKIEMDNAGPDNMRMLEVKVAFNNGQMNIIRKLLDD